MIILASGSLQRKRILKNLGVPFRAISSAITESHDGLKKPHAVARHIALKKAKAIAKKHPDSWVMGIDTLVVLPDGKICGKPKDKKQARSVLKQYSAKYCDVYSGIAMVHQKLNKKFVQHEKTRIHFRAFSLKEISKYLKLNKWQGSSGSMTIEGEGGRWVKHLEGNYWNVVGLPIKALKKILLAGGEPLCYHFRGL
jgi:septum formation protein